MTAPFGERLLPDEILNIQRGASVFIYAAALSLIFSPQKLTQEIVDTTFRRLIPAMNRTYGLTRNTMLLRPADMPSMPRPLSQGEVIGGMDLSGIQLRGFHTELLALLQEKAHLKEDLAQAQLIALV